MTTNGDGVEPAIDPRDYWPAPEPYDVADDVPSDCLCGWRHHAGEGTVQRTTQHVRCPVHGSSS